MLITFMFIPSNYLKTFDLEVGFFAYVIRHLHNIKENDSNAFASLKTSSKEFCTKRSFYDFFKIAMNDPARLLLFSVNFPLRLRRFSTQSINSLLSVWMQLLETKQTSRTWFLIKLDFKSKDTLSLKTSIVARETNIQHIKGFESFVSPIDTVEIFPVAGMAIKWLQNYSKRH